MVREVMTRGCWGAAFLVLACSAQPENRPGDSGTGHGYVSSRPWLARGKIGDALEAEMLVSDHELPRHFDWRDVNGKSFITSDWNQHIPEYCGSCWIHGTTHALNDRIKVARGAKFPDVMLGRQSIMNCVPDPKGHGPPPGCDGGDPWMIHKYMHEHKVPDQTCMPYRASNMGCTNYTVCRNCYPSGGGCFEVQNYIGYGVRSYGNLSGELRMQKEIYARGPIVCSFATDMGFLANFSENAVQHEGVYVSDKHYNESQVDHNMEVTGWGETSSGLKYWVIRNSWGTYWGEGGWFKLRRGTNDLRSEDDCDWAEVTYGDLDEVLTGRAIGDYARGIASVHAYTLAGAARPLARDMFAPEKDSWTMAPEMVVSLVVGAFVAGAIFSAGVVRVKSRFFGLRGAGRQPLLG